MKILSAFREFASRVLNAVKKGGLPKTDILKLDHLLSRTGKRNLILAKGILTALDAGGASRRDIERFGSLLEKANHRIFSSKEPFTEKERKELAAIFRRCAIPTKATRHFTKNIDELLAEQINESIKGKRKMRMGIPKKKSVQIKEKKRRIKA